MQTKDASMLLGVPLWWSYVPISAAFGVLVLSALYRACCPNEEQQGAHV